jgi:hypothetical protein
MQPLDPDHYEMLLSSETAYPSAPRLLLVCMHFARPRHTGGLRWRALARDLPKLGWSLDVLAADPSHPAERFPVEPIQPGPSVTQYLIPQHRWDESIRLRLRDAWWSLLDTSAPARQTSSPLPPLDPDELPVWTLGQQKALPVRLKDDLVGLAEVVRDSIWTRRATVTARRLAEQHDYHALIVSSPVHLTHRVGIDLARRYGMPYVADFRDPLYYGRRADLTRIDAPRRVLWRSLEHRILRHCRVAVDIAEGAQQAVKADLAERGPADIQHTPRVFIPNGYDALADPPPPPDPDCFRVAYTGSLLPFMDLRALFAACGRLRTRYGLVPSTFRIELMGTDSHFNGVSLHRIATAYGVGDCFHHYDRRPPREADALQQAAAVLVAYDSVCTQGLCIPTKLYYYARTRGALLLMGHPEGALAREAAKIGVPVYPYHDLDGVDAALDVAYRTWRETGFTTPIDAQGRFDNRRSAVRMHNLLNSLGSRTLSRSS